MIFWRCSPQTSAAHPSTVSGVGAVLGQQGGRHRRKFLFRSGKTNVEALDLPKPHPLLGFSESRLEVVLDLDETGFLVRIWA
jgi:hypothetical protein